MLSHKEQYLQIFKYLKEYASFRERVVNTLDNYENVLWFEEIPNNQYCLSIVSEHDKSGTEWLKVKKPKEPRIPTIPENLSQWIDSETLKQYSEIPNLKPEIETLDGKLYLINFPDIKKDYQAYIDNMWLSWAVQYREYAETNKIYKKLYEIYEKANKFGEEFELIVGLGLLFFKKEDSKLIKRHVLTASATLDFDSEKGMFSLSEGVDGAKIKVETDMLQDLSYLNASEAAKDLETKIEENELNETPFAEEIKPLLETFSNRLPCDDHLIDKPTATVLGTPSLFFAPAIVLRKRNLRSLSASFQKIIDFLETREDINLPVLNDLIATSTDSQGIPSQNSNKPFPIEEIFFPKAYNAEQLQILGRLNANDKVLVQGPPGTGKSHTIANLISHLLAHGNKILVTAYSKRALSVLKDKLPEEVQPLCVSLLGNDRGSINDLEASVKGITARINNPDSIPDQQKIAQLEKNLYEAKKTKAELENDLILLREKDTRKLHLTAVYNGSLLEIAKKINADKQQYGWFIDSVHSLENIDALLTDVSTLIQEHKHFSVLPESEFFCEFPDKTKLISVEDLHNLGEYKKAFEMLTAQNRSNALPELANSLKNLSVQDIHNLKDFLAELQHIQKQLQLCKMPWAEKAITECKSGHDTTWNHIYEETGKILSTQLKQRADAFDREHKIEYPEELSKQKLKADAKVLLAYTKKGGSLKGWKLFKNTEVKERWYFTEKIFVDGSSCDTYEELELLIEFLEMELDFEQLSNLWSFHVGQNNSFNTYALQLTGFEKRQKELAHILAILNKKQATENAILNLTRWNKALLDQQLETCFVSTEYATLKKNIDVAEYIQKSSIKLLTGGNLHSIVEIIRNSIETGDVARYQESLAILNKKEKEYTSYWQYKERTKKIAGVLPELTKKILDVKTAFDFNGSANKIRY